MKVFLCLLSVLLLAVPTLAQQSSLPPCGDRPTVISEPWTNGLLWCLEQVIRYDSAGELAFTALATAPNGTLFATRPLSGEVLAITDTNTDGLPDSAQVVVRNLTLPNGLLFYEDALYITGGSNLYRLRDGQMSTLRDDIPAGSGFWTGSLAVGPDERLYFATGANCDQCSQVEQGRGTIFSTSLDGTDLQPFASGFRNPADLTFFENQLWVIDSSLMPLADAASPSDELNLVLRDSHHGFPSCLQDCPTASSPFYAFPHASQPLGITAYQSDTFSSLTDTLLVTLGGDYNSVTLAGYMLIALTPQADGQFAQNVLIPDLSLLDTQRSIFTTQELSYRRSGFWPHRPLDVAVSPEGWIYVSISGGRIIALRPHAL